MSLEENISHCFREYPKMKLRIEILEEENQQLWAEVARLREALLFFGRHTTNCALVEHFPRWSEQRCDCGFESALEVGK